MRFAVLFLTCVLTVLLNRAGGQSRFDTMQSSVLATASNQWLVQELRNVNPSYFRCDRQDWILPMPGKFPLYGDTVTLSPEHIARFRNIWFPQNDCKRFLSVVALADVYMPLFKRKAELMSLHPDVAFLPIVLSGCNQEFSVGDASGLWAMPFLAARRQHLRIDSLVDERLGGDFTTDAALKHFSFLLSIHRADYWRATVAFTSGPSQLTLIDTTLQGVDMLSRLNPETVDALLFQAYTNQLFRLVHLENQMNNCFDILGHFQPVIIEKPLQIKAIAEVLAVDESRLRKTNPVYTGQYLQTGYRKVPFVLEDTLVGRFTLLKDSIARWQPAKPKAITSSDEWESYFVQHRVGKGETLGRIAGKYHVTIAQIKKWNKLLSDKIRKGQTLRIEQRRRIILETPAPKVDLRIEADSASVGAPVISDSLILVHKSDSLFAKGQKLMSQKKYKEAVRTFDELLSLAPTHSEALELRKQAQDAAKAQIASEKSSVKYYTVKSGDSLWSIARKYPGVTENDLMKWNKCGANIRPGQRLIIKK
jgi:membrane-bound lytic murein transglycosylase D